MPPVVLGIDTSGSWCSTALARGAEVHARRAEVGNAHSDHLLSMVESALAQAGISLAQCDAIAYSAGPGSFTGLRVGCAVAQGLAFGASLPVAAIGSLDAIARSILHTEPAFRGTTLVAQDARMGEVYWALFDLSEGQPIAVTEAALAPPDRLHDALAAIGRPSQVVGCGNAWSVYRDELRGLVDRVVPRASADAVDVAALGVMACLDGRLIAAELASPLYVRNEVARTTAQRQVDAAARAA